MAERKQGPVKPPTIDLTAREASAEKPSQRRSASRRPAAEAAAPAPDVQEAPAVAEGADSTPSPQPVPPVPPTPSDPSAARPRAVIAAASPSWSALLTAAAVGALLGTALTYVLATVVPLPGPQAPNLAPELSAQADRVTTLEERLAAAEAGTLDLRATVDATAGDAASRLTALEGVLPAVGTAPQSADLGAIEARLRTLTSRVDAIAAGASSADAGAMAENIGDLERALSTLQAEVTALGTRTGAADNALGALEAEVAALKTAIETAAEPEPPAPAAIPVVVASLESAFATGRPYAAELAELTAEQPPVAIDEGLASRAGTGLVRPDVLDRAFAAAVPMMLEARPRSGEGLQETASDLLSSLLAIRPAGETEGDTPDAIVSRLEGAMSRHDYAAASALFAALPPEMTAAAGTVPADIAAHAAAAALVAELRQRTSAP